MQMAKKFIRKIFAVFMNMRVIECFGYLGREEIVMTAMQLATKIGIYQFAISECLKTVPEKDREVMQDMVDTLRETQLFLYESAREQIIKELGGAPF